MFNFFKPKKNYDEIFTSVSETYQYIYGDRSKTSEVLGSEEFIDAWLASKNVAQVNSVIIGEAIKGDVPSIKQMIWLCDVYYNDAENLTNDKNKQREIKVQALKDRIMFCDKAIAHGLKEHSYYAMISCANLYSILAPLQTSISDEDTRSALNGIITHANLFLDSGYDDSDLITDAKELLRRFGPKAQIIKILNK